jgi:hypothetical protein
MLRALAFVALVGALAARAAQAAPALGAPEEALDRAVHLTWRDADAPAREYELQRRQRDASGWSPWAKLAEIPAAAGSAAAHFDDRGVAGSGLAPGEYEYRVRGRHRAAEASAGAAWSEWSAAAAIALPASCEPPPGAPALATVAGGDRDGDGRLSGDDLVRALEDCAAWGGCVLELGPERYDDVAILLHDGRPIAWCTPSRTACLQLAFPKGLVLQGHGSSTVLRSPVWSSPYRPWPVVEILNRPDIRFAMRNLVLDGRKAEQPDPKPGENDHVTWHHHGFRSWQMGADGSRPSRDGCIHNVTVRNFMSDGLRLGSAERWAIESCTVEDVGCHRQISPCPKLQIPEIGPGEATSGYGILIDGFVGALTIRDNRIRRVTKYSIGLKHGHDASVPSIVDPRVTGNQIREAGSIGIFLGGIQGGLVRDNLIDHTQRLNDTGKRANYYDTFGISCVGRLDRTRISDNRILRSAGIGVNWQCSGTGNVLSGNRIEGSCRQKNPHTCAPGFGRAGCYDYADITIKGTTGGPLHLLDNEVADTGCSSPLEIWGAPPQTEVVIEGGRYGGGPNLRGGARLHGVSLLVKGGAVFEGVDLEFDRAARAVVTPSVSVPKVHKDGSGPVLVCSRDRAACEAVCRAPEPPDWCSELAQAR